MKHCFRGGLQAGFAIGRLKPIKKRGSLPPPVTINEAALSGRKTAEIHLTDGGNSSPGRGTRAFQINPSGPAMEGRSGHAYHLLFRKMLNNSCIVLLLRAKRQKELIL